MFLALDLARIIINIGWISLAVIVFFILYRLMLRNMKKNVTDPVKYAILHEVEQNPASGQIQFYITMAEKHVANFELYNKDGSHRIVLKEGDFEPKGHIITFDTSQVPNGHYFYELKTENQKTSKILEIRNL